MLQPKLTKVEPVKPLKLCLYYETGEVKLFDAAPYATGSWYGRLQDERYFATVHLLPGGIFSLTYFLTKHNKNPQKRRFVKFYGAWLLFEKSRV